MKTILTRRSGLTALRVSALVLASCNRGAPPGSEGGAIAHLPFAADAGGTAESPDPGNRDATGNADATLGDDRASAADAGDAPGAAQAPSSDVDAGALPQTRDRPTADGPAFEGRARALLEGLAHDDPERALPFFFPLAAYEQVKGIANPAGDWRRRLVGNYARDIHALAHEVGPDARFVRIEVPKAVRWVEPNEEYNRLGYYRVYGAQIVYTKGESDRERAVRISSMIAWRGEWYVVHLTGFK